MSQPSKHSRGQFTSSFGFVLAAAGSAIGLGNLWKFPYVAGIGRPRIQKAVQPKAAKLSLQAALITAPCVLP